jgi:general secretion pathway protein A
MYRHYYGLQKKPFDLIPDPSIVFMSEAHQEALAILRYGIIDRKGFLLLTGDVGTGKSSLLNLLVRSLADRVHVCLINNPTLSVSDFYEMLALRFKLPAFKGSKAQFLENFASFLECCRQQKERVLLIIDEAHALPMELLEEIRLLSNQEYLRYGLLSIFLVGQPELNQCLAHERLLPLRQRIAIRFHLAPFSRQETNDYIAFRLRHAGTQHLTLFSDEAIDLIHQATKGVPRLINILCDQALLTGFSDSQPSIDGAIIRRCLQDLHIPGEADLLALPPQKSGLPRNGFLWAGVAALLIVGTGFWLWHTYLLPLAGAAQNLRGWLTSLGDF